VCEMCNEKSHIRSSVLCNDSIKIDMAAKDAENQTSAVATNATTTATTTATMTTAAATISSSSSGSVAEVKEYNKPVTRTSAHAGEHVCCHDISSIYCLICQQPMLFAFASNLEYPSMLGDKLLDKITVLEAQMTDKAYTKIARGLNGGHIIDSDKYVMCTETGKELATWVSDDMQISITIGGEETAYSGPGVDALIQIFTAAVTRKQPMIMLVSVTNAFVNDSEDMFLAIYPNGDVYLIDPTLGPSPFPEVEPLIRAGVTGIRNVLNSTKLKYINNSTWSRTCVKQSQTYIDFTGSPMWRLVMQLAMMSMISLGLSIKDTVSLLVEQDKQTMCLLLGLVAERALAAITPEDFTKQNEMPLDSSRAAPMRIPRSPQSTRDG
jgi:hypothetical protein